MVPTHARAIFIATIFIVAALLTAPAEARQSNAVRGDELPSTTEFPLVGEVNADRVNLRAGGGRDYRSLRKLEPKEKLIIVAEQGEWFEVRVPGGFTAYILERLLDRSGEKGVTVHDRRVNARPTPATRYFPVGQIERGETFTVLEVKDGWAKILAPESMTAWVHKPFVTILGPEKDYEIELAGLAANARTAYLGGEIPAEEAAAAAMRLDVEKKFKTAESLYRAQSDIENPDFSEAITVYEEVAEQNVSPELASRAKLRLEGIERESKRLSTIQEVQGIQHQLEERLADVQDQFEESIRKRPEPTLVIESKPEGEIGWVVRNYQFSLLKDAGPEYRLVKGGQTLMHLSSLKYDLKDFADKQVKVTGELAEISGVAGRHMIIRKMEILSER